MPLGRTNRGTTHITAKTQSLSDSNKSKAVYGATGFHYWGFCPFTKPAPEAVSFLSCTVSQQTTAL